jgi:hypothetical protein
MPKRKRTRAKEHAQRISAERARNELALERAEYEANPPPF